MHTPGTLPDSTTLGWLSKLIVDGCVDPVVNSTDQRITEVSIQSVGDLVRIVELWHTGGCQYRGQANDDDLLPSLTRPGKPGLAKEKHILKQFRNEAVAYYSDKSIELLSDLELAMLAQHHLVPTRLLDWSLNPLAALYFAVEGDCKGDYSVVWAVPGERFFKHQIAKTADLEKAFDGLDHPDSRYTGLPFFVLPDHSIARAPVQGSLFSLWKAPGKTFLTALGTSGALWKIKIPKSRRDAIKWTLHCHGVARSTLFPDLDGLGGYIAWKHSGDWEDNYFTTSRPQPRP